MEERYQIPVYKKDIKNCFCVFIKKRNFNYIYASFTYHLEGKFNALLFNKIVRYKNPKYCSLYPSKIRVVTLINHAVKV